MKLYQIVLADFNQKTKELGDEHVTFQGFDYEEAKAALVRALIDFEKMSEYDKNHSIVEGRVYEIEDTVDTSDEDEIIEALIDCLGYNDLTLTDAEKIEAGLLEPAKTIRDLRIETGMSQHDFAEFFNIPKDS